MKIIFINIFIYFSCARLLYKSYLNVFKINFYVK